jgi:hypothetical protein
MNSSSKLGRAALVAAIAMSFGATPLFAQGTSSSARGDSMTQNNSANDQHQRAGARGVPDPTSPTSGTGASGRGNAGVADAETMDSWATTHAGRNQGRVSRDAYMNEMGRRWDSLDRNQQGLTPAELSRLRGTVDVEGAGYPRSGSGAQAGDMGPSNSKGQ